MNDALTDRDNRTILLLTNLQNFASQHQGELIALIDAWRIAERDCPEPFRDNFIHLPQFPVNRTLLEFFRNECIARGIGGWELITRKLIDRSLAFQQQETNAERVELENLLLRLRYAASLETVGEKPTKKGRRPDTDAAADSALYTHWLATKSSRRLTIAEFAEDRKLRLKDVKAAFNREKVRRSKARQAN